jgi:hypothetical protein
MPRTMIHAQGEMDKKTITQPIPGQSGFFRVVLFRFR